MLSKATLLIIVLCLICNVSATLAALGTYTGREPGFWQRQFIIVARVNGVHTLDRQRDPQEDATHILSLEPLLTLAGNFDPSRQPVIKVRVAVTAPSSTIQSSSVTEPPREGSIVLAVIGSGNIDSDDRRPFLWVASEICLFMPDEAGLVTLQGLSDKRILETLKKVRERRGANPPASQPSDKE